MTTADEVMMYTKITELYRERARLLAWLATAYGQAVHIGFDDPDAPGWPVLTFETAAGQLSWHIAPDDVALFSEVRPTMESDPPWDGHATDEKYDRIKHLMELIRADREMY